MRLAAEPQRSRRARWPTIARACLFDLYDRARAAENQVVVVTANLSGAQGRLRFLAQSKVVLPDGAVAVRTGFRPGIAVRRRRRRRRSSPRPASPSTTWPSAGRRRTGTAR